MATPITNQALNNEKVNTEPSVFLRYGTSISGTGGSGSSPRPNPR